MRIPALALALTAAYSPVFSDAVGDFDRLKQTFPTLSLQVSPEVQVAWARDFVAGFSGRWVLIGPMLDDGGNFPDAELFSKVCDKSSYTVKPNGTFGFDLELATKTAPMIIHLQWAGGTSFVSQYDEQTMLARLFGDQVGEMQDNVLYSALVFNSWLGTVNLIPAGADLIFMQPEKGQADVFARCP